MWYRKSVTVVLPAYNEVDNIARAVRDFRDLTLSDGSRLVDRVLVIDNNSSDGTAEAAREAGATVLTESAQGYGNAMIRGLREADSDLIVLCEPDGTFVATDTIKLCSYAHDFDMVCGTRTTREMVWEQANMRWPLRVGNLLVAKLLEVLYDTCSLSDCGCSFRLISRDGRDTIVDDLYVGASHFLPNMVIAARSKGLSFIEIPVNYRARIGTSKITGTGIGTVKTALAMIYVILAEWPSFATRRR